MSGYPYKDCKIIMDWCGTKVRLTGWTNAGKEVCREHGNEFFQLIPTCCSLEGWDEDCILTSYKTGKNILVNLNDNDFLVDIGEKPDIVRQQ